MYDFLTVEFQSTLPSQGATQNNNQFQTDITFQSTLPSQGATNKTKVAHDYVDISIHAPLTGSDNKTKVAHDYVDISIHAPLTGSDVPYIIYYTLICNFNPRSPHRERQLKIRLRRLHYHFNPRSPHRERLAVRYAVLLWMLFQSTLPSQGATCCYVCGKHPELYFNPRSPHRERLFFNLRCVAHILFQSTLPSQGATANIHIKFLCDLLFSTLSSKNSFTLSRFPQTIT